MTSLVSNRLPSITREISDRIRPVVVATCHRIEAQAKISMTGPKHGRTYQRAAIGRRMSKSLAGAGLKTYQTAKGTTMAIVGYKYHRASAPGEAPAVDTGALMNATRTKMTGKTSGMVYNNMDYAATLELKRNRKFMEPAAEAERDNFTAGIAAALKGL